MQASPRRTYMLMPGHEEKKARKASGLDVDVVLLDMEDGVPPAHKQAARDGIVVSLAGIDFGPREVMARINGVDTDLWQDDIAALAGTSVRGIFIPKVESAAQVAAVADALERAGLSGIAVVATIETARGLIHVEEIAAAGGGLTGLFFGSGDYSLSTGIEISRETLLYPRSRIAVAAAANGLQPIDAAFFRNVKDGEAARRDAQDARVVGFTAKVAFHPNQLAPITEALMPSPEEVARARKILDAYRSSLGSERGVFLVDGEFVAVDIALMAERTLERAGAR